MRAHGMGLDQALADKLLGQSHRLGHQFLAGEIGRQGGGKHATGAVRLGGFDTRGGIDLLITLVVQHIHHVIAGQVPSLDDTRDIVQITDFLGGNFNPVSGDFSAGIRGFYYEKGRRVKPVSEMNIAGNLLTVLPLLKEIGNDPYPYRSTRAPAMRFDGVVISGV